MDRKTVDLYEQHAAEWRDQRTPRHFDLAQELGAAVTTAPTDSSGAVADLGCGPGWYTAHLGDRPVAVDAAKAMLDLVPEYAPTATRVQADLAALPFARGSLGGAFGSKSYVHLARSSVPMAFGDLHRSLAVGAPVRLLLFAGDQEHTTLDNDDFGVGRRFSLWPADLLRDVVVGAGFEDVAVDGPLPEPDGYDLRVSAVRARTLADTVGPNMRLLVCGLNPSVYAADAGIGFARPGNRYWPAALAAGLVSRDRDPRHALEAHGIGMTDICKRATPRADELSVAEYRDGMARLERLVTWLQPRAICFVGLTGWRVAVDKQATAGWQPSELGGCPVYLMPSTSGVNAHASLATLTEHMRTAIALRSRP